MRLKMSFSLLAAMSSARNAPYYRFHSMFLLWQAVLRSAHWHHQSNLKPLDVFVWRVASNVSKHEVRASCSAWQQTVTKHLLVALVSLVLTTTGDGACKIVKRKFIKGRPAKYFSTRVKMLLPPFLSLSHT
uniref:Uncharacterized protein n=1 Tax=Ixodes ricinus TaxID=34613 RepID=A0A6B0URT1_IXORI